MWNENLGATVAADEEMLGKLLWWARLLAGCSLPHSGLLRSLENSLQEARPEDHGELVGAWLSLAEPSVSLLWPAPLPNPDEVLTWWLDGARVS